MKYQMLFFLLSLLSGGLYGQGLEFYLKTSETQIRDPFIYADKETGLYYMYAASRILSDSTASRAGVMVYKSKDLNLWTKPESVMVLHEESWADVNHSVWAPEVHQYRGKYYLFCTLTSEKEIETPKNRPRNVLRGTQIFVSDKLTGPFVSSNHKEPITPGNWMALDGTLVFENDQPYMVFCHEWTQIGDGTFELMPLNSTLSGALAEPVTIFKASDALWTRSGVNYGGRQFSGRVTDGPWFHTTQTGKLLTLWSSFDEHGYCLSYATSQTGTLKGPYTHPVKPLLNEGHGHGCLFYSFDGQLMLTCHYPNNTPKARAVFYEIDDSGDDLKIVKKRTTQ